MINKVMLLARLGTDPELKEIGDTKIITFRVATSKKFKTDDGEKQENTTWHSIKVFGKTGELAHKYLKKGSQCFIDGEISNSSWDDKKTGEKRYKSEVIAHSIQFIGGKSDTQETITEMPMDKSGPPVQDDLPF